MELRVTSRKDRTLLLAVSSVRSRLPVSIAGSEQHAMTPILVPQAQDEREAVRRDGGDVGAGAGVHLLPPGPPRLLRVGRRQRAAGRHDLRHLRAQAQGAERAGRSPGARPRAAALLGQPVHLGRLPAGHGAGRARQDHQYQHPLQLRLPLQRLLGRDSALTAGIATPPCNNVRCSRFFPNPRNSWGIPGLLEPRRMDRTLRRGGID